MIAFLKNKKRRGDYYEKNNCKNLITRNNQHLELVLLLLGEMIYK